MIDSKSRTAKVALRHAVGSLFASGPGASRGAETKKESDGMPTEIERKFLVQDSREFQEVSPTPVLQGYLSRGAGEEVRIRRIGQDCTLAVKKGAGLVRVEYEIGIRQDEFETLWPATEGSRVTKTRREVRLDGEVSRLIYVDVFSGVLAGLTTAEVEFDTIEAAADFVAPSWFGREITDDYRYSNGVLSSEGLPR